MSSITIKNIPDDLYKQIRQYAGQNRRSINSEIIYRLYNTILAIPFNSEHFLNEVRKYRKNTKPISEKIIKEAKNKGRK